MITVTLGENPNYEVSATNGTFTIGKKAATVTADNKSKTYGADDPALTATVEGTVGNDTINYTLSRAEGNNVGEYTITVNLGDNPNYDVTTTNGTFTIGKKAATVTADNKSKTYGADDPTLTAVVEGTIGTDTINYTLSRAEGNNVGEYTITVTLGDNPNYDVTTTNGTFTIGKKAATVTADNKSKTYGDDDPALTAVVEGIVGNDAISYTLSRAEGENVDEYVITVTLGENPNYEVSATNAKLTIGKKSASVTADNKSKTYGDADPELTAVVEGTVGNDTINYTLSRAEGNNVGEYVITVTLGENPNYDVTVAGAKLTIVKKAVTLTAVDKSKTYGEADPALTATVEGVVGTDIINYTLSRAEGNNVGEYAITVTLGENPNYDVTVTGAKLTIGKKAATVTANNKAKTYGEVDPALTATVAGTVGADTINYTLSRTEGNNVGEYAITVTLGENPNYEVTVTNAKLTIGKKAATITAADKSKTYGEDDPELTATVEGTVGLDAINYTLSRAEGENVGEYDIVVTLGNNPNYDVTVKDGAFTINKKTITVKGDNQSKTYGEADPTLTATVEGTVGTDTINYTLSRAEGNNVGEYVITVTLGNNPNYDVTVKGGAFTINKKTITVKGDNQSKTYGDADPTLTYKVEGLVGSDTLTGELAREAGENVGTYAISAGTLDAGNNYVVNFTGAEFTIGAKTVVVTANDQSKVVGANDPELTYTATGLVGSDTLSGALERVAGEDEGTYEITQGTLSAGKNYVISFTGATFTIYVNHVKTDVNVDEGAPEMEIENINEEAANSLLTEEEKKALDNGEQVKIYLEVIAVDEEIVPEGDKTAIGNEAKKSGTKVGMYLDLSLLKEVGESGAVAIHDTEGNMVKVTVTVPENLRNTDPNVKRTFYVVRVHDGVATVLGESTGDTVSFETDKFSTYSLTYKDEKTTSLTWLWIILAVVVLAGAGVAVFFFIKKKKKTTK